MQTWIDPFTQRAIKSWPKGDGGVTKLVRRPPTRGHGSPLAREDLLQFISAGVRVRQGQRETELAAPIRRPRVRGS